MPEQPSRGDANEKAADLVARSAARQNHEVPRDLDAAWAEWAKRFKGVDERTLTLLQAAFEAGYHASKRRD